MKTAKLIFPMLAMAALSGCRAHVVTIRLINTSNQPLSTLIVDYPNATFGKDKLAPGETFASIVKPLDSGAMKVQFIDAAGRNHSYTGPTLHKDDDGSVDIKLTQDGALATPSITEH